MCLPGKSRRSMSPLEPASSRVDALLTGRHGHAVPPGQTVQPMATHQETPCAWIVAPRTGRDARQLESDPARLRLLPVELTDLAGSHAHHDRLDLRRDLVKAKLAEQVFAS